MTKKPREGAYLVVLLFMCVLVNQFYAFGWNNLIGFSVVKIKCVTLPTVENYVEKIVFLIYRVVIFLVSY